MNKDSLITIFVFILSFVVLFLVGMTMILEYQWEKCRKACRQNGYYGCSEIQDRQYICYDIAPHYMMEGE